MTIKKILNEHDYTWGYTENALPLSYEHFEEWIENSNHQPLNFLKENGSHPRSNILKFYEHFQSALVFLFPYIETKMQLDNLKKQNDLEMASYVLGFEGDDYHFNILKRLQKIADDLLFIYPNLKFKFSLDTSPVMERDLAFKAGLGQFGKNSMLINEQLGSFFIIGTILLSEKIDLLTSNTPQHKDICGSCRKCIEACPTNAILSDKKNIVASKCIATYTVETFKDTPPPQGYPTSNEFFGCEVCQNVCPWNEKVKKTLNISPMRLNEKQKQILDFFYNRSKEDIIIDLQNMSNRGFKKIFKGTSFERTGRVGILKNLTSK